MRLPWKHYRFPPAKGAARLLESLSQDAPLEEDENLALVLERVRRYEAGEMTVQPASEKHGL